MRPGLIRLQAASSSFYPIRRLGPPRCTTMSRQPPPQNLSSEPHTSDPPNYETWTREELITRIKELTAQSSISTSPPSHALPPAPAQSPPPQLTTSGSDHRNLKPAPKNKKAKKHREFNFSAYPTR